MATVVLLCLVVLGLLSSALPAFALEWSYLPCAVVSAEVAPYALCGFGGFLFIYNFTRTTMAPASPLMAPFHFYSRRSRVCLRFS